VKKPRLSTYIYIYIYIYIYRERERERGGEVTLLREMRSRENNSLALFE